MRKLKRETIAVAVSSAFLIVAGVPVSASPPTGHPDSAAGRDITIQSCYGSAKSYTTNASWEWPPAGWAKTTSACADITIKPNQGTYARACFQVNGYCSTMRWAPAGTWTMITSNVYDGSDFSIDFDRPSSGLAAY